MFVIYFCRRYAISIYIRYTLSKSKKTMVGRPSFPFGARSNFAVKMMGLGRWSSSRGGLIFIERNNSPSCFTAKYRQWRAISEERYFFAGHHFCYSSWTSSMYVATRQQQPKWFPWKDNWVGPAQKTWFYYYSGLLVGCQKTKQWHTHRYNIL